MNPPVAIAFLFLGFRSGINTSSHLTPLEVRLRPSSCGVVSVPYSMGLSAMISAGVITTNGFFGERTTSNHSLPPSAHSKPCHADLSVCLYWYLSFLPNILGEPICFYRNCTRSSLYNCHWKPVTLWHLLDTQFLTDSMAAPVDPATRKRVLRVVFISLLLDLVCIACHSRRETLWYRCVPIARAPRLCSTANWLGCRSASHLYYHFSQNFWNSIEI